MSVLRPARGHAERDGRRSTRLLCGAVVILAAIFAAAQAWSAEGRDPTTLVLTRSDLPVGTRVVARRAGARPTLPGTQGATARFKPSRHYEVTYRAPTKDVYSGAFVFRSAALARTAFVKLSHSLAAFHRPVRVLPRLGDAQRTTYVVADGLEHQFIVRRGSVVWELDVVDWNARSRARSRAEALALARSQQARVG